MKKRLISVCLMLLGAFLAAQTESLNNQLEMSPSGIKEIDSDKAVLEIKTDISNVEVYLNGMFYGRTNLEITDLLPGIYSVELKKSGYETQNFSVLAKKGFLQTYYFEMKLIQGTITFLNLPEGAQISLDEEKQNYDYKNNGSYQIYAVPGNHNVKVSCFGYEDFDQEITLEKYKDYSVILKMEPAAFDVSDFSASKTVFNPDYKGRLGVCDFNFNVTNKGSVKIEIYNSDKLCVWTEVLDNFNVREQKFSWDGKDNDGNTLENGEYFVKLFIEADEAYEQTAGNIKITISRSLDYPLFNINAVGSGVGPLPSVPASPFDFVAAYLNVSPVAVINLEASEEYFKTAFYGLGLNAGVVWDFKNHFEVCGQIFTMPGYSNGFAGRINGSFKAFNSLEFAQDFTFSYGGLVRFGLSSAALYAPYAIDNGSGIGAGGLLSLSRTKWSAGFSSQFIYSASTGKLTNTDWIFKNALNGTFKPVKSLSLSGWIGLNYAVNNSGLNYGAGLSWLPFSSAVIVNLNLDGNLIFSHINYLSAQFGLSYLF